MMREARRLQDLSRGGVSEEVARDQINYIGILAKTVSDTKCKVENYLASRREGSNSSTQENLSSVAGLHRHRSTSPAGAPVVEEAAAAGASSVADVSANRPGA